MTLGKKAIKANIVSVYKISVLEKARLKWSRCPCQKILASGHYALVLIPYALNELELAELGYPPPPPPIYSFVFQDLQKG